MLLSVAILTGIFLIVSSAALYFTSENSAVRMQKEYSQATLAQINYNISSMDEIAKNMTSSLFWDRELSPLLSDQDLDILDLTGKLNRLDRLVTSSSFLDSIVFYNGDTKKLFSGGNPKFRNTDTEQTMRLLKLFETPESVLKMKLIPMDLSDKTSGVEAFTFFMYDSLGPYKKGESALALNIKPEWVFNNIRMINDMDIRRASSFFLVNREGEALLPSGSLPIEPESLRQAVAEDIRDDEPAGYKIRKIDGEKYIVSYSETLLPDWYAVSLQPYSTVIHSIEQIRQTSLWLTLLFLTLSLVASVFVSSRLYRPIERLLVHIRKNGVGGGESASKDELAFVADSYSRAIQSLSEVKQYQRDNRDIIDSYHFRKLLSDSASCIPEQYQGIFGSGRLHVGADGVYRVLVLSVDGVHELNRAMPAGDLNLLHFAIVNIGEEILSRKYGCKGSEMKPEHVAFLLQTNEGANRQEEAIALAELIGDIQSVVYRYYRITIGVAASETANLHGISDQYRLAQQMLSYKLVFGKQAIITEPMVAANMRASLEAVPAELEKRLAEGIKTGSLETMEIALDKLVAHLANCNYDDIMAAMTQIPVIIRQTLKEINQNRVQSADLDLNYLCLELVAMESLEDVRERLGKVALEISRLKKNGLDDRNEILVETIKEIVKQNYGDLNLSLRSIAGMMKLSGDYVGRLFRKSELLSVADYINEIRLNKTQALLENNSYSINEVMERCGFANQSYFFKIFKKKLGCTPGEYRLKRSILKKS